MNSALASPPVKRSAMNAEGDVVTAMAAVVITLTAMPHSIQRRRLPPTSPVAPASAPSR